MTHTRLQLLALGTAGLFALSFSSHAALTSSNLLAYYNFDGQSNDQAGNGAPNATLVGPAVIGAGGSGYTGGGADGSLGLGAINDGAAATVGAGTHFDSAFANDAMAVSYWQLNTGVGSSSSFWVHSPTASNNVRGFQGHVAWGNGSIFFDSAGCCTSPTQRLTDNPVGTTAITVDTWQHFVFQKDAAGNKQVWINGNLYLDQLGGAASLLAFDGQLTIGAEPPAANSFGGSIDEFAVWNTALTPAEIQALAGGASTPSIIPEPSGALLSFLGVVLLAARRRRS